MFTGLPGNPLMSNQDGNEGMRGTHRDPERPISPPYQRRPLTSSCTCSRDKKLSTLRILMVYSLYTAVALKPIFLGFFTGFLYILPENGDR